MLRYLVLLKNYMFDSKRPTLKANKRPRKLEKVNMGSLQYEIVEGSFILGLEKLYLLALFENKDHIICIAENPNQCQLQYNLSICTRIHQKCPRESETTDYGRPERK